MPFTDYHTEDQLHKLRQAEIERAIRSGIYVKHEAELTIPRRRSKFLLSLLRILYKMRGDRSKR